MLGLYCCVHGKFTALWKDALTENAVPSLGWMRPGQDCASNASCENTSWFKGDLEGLNGVFIPVLQR